MQNLLERLLVAPAVVLFAVAPLLSPASAPLQNPHPPILRVSTSKLIMFSCIRFICWQLMKNGHQSLLVSQAVVFPTLALLTPVSHQVPHCRSTAHTQAELVITKNHGWFHASGTTVDILCKNCYARTSCMAHKLMASQSTLLCLCMSCLTLTLMSKRSWKLPLTKKNMGKMPSPGSVPNYRHLHCPGKCLAFTWWWLITG